ncbi:MAG: hypothetical protein AMJ73_00765 [candidate division Zixibacteria bacterium SM1_73]|nr:MAG: hypothetical protein AMJ73_00765 [candidate division Zixibacteria bacterium SM1_73]
MGTISKDTFKRLVLLYTIGRFKDGVYGLLRLNKVAYFGLKNASLKPFGFKCDLYGPHSGDLDTINEQLLSMNHTKATPLESGQGNKYSLTDKKSMRFYSLAMSHTHAKLKEKINKSVETYGYLPEEELLKKAHSDPEYLEAVAKGIDIFEEKLPPRIPVDLSDDDCEDLELGLDPDFISAMRRV